MIRDPFWRTNAAKACRGNAPALAVLGYLRVAGDAVPLARVLTDTGLPPAAVAHGVALLVHHGLAQSLPNGRLAWIGPPIPHALAGVDGPTSTHPDPRVRMNARQRPDVLRAPFAARRSRS